MNTGDLPVKSVSCGAWHAAAITGHDPGMISRHNLVAVTRPAIVREIPHFAFFPAFVRERPAFLALFFLRIFKNNCLPFVC